MVGCPSLNEMTPRTGCKSVVYYPWIKKLIHSGAFLAALCAAQGARASTSTEPDAFPSDEHDITNRRDSNPWIIANPSHPLRPFIVGGVAVQPDEFPQFARAVGTVGSCGGTLIHPDVVLSAAHCQGVFNAGIYVGAWQRPGVGGRVGTFRQIDHQTPHPGYSELFLDYVGNDILLVRLAEPIYEIPPMTLNADIEIPRAWEPVTAIGMGLTRGDNRSSLSDTLLKAPCDLFRKTSVDKIWPILRMFYLGRICCALDIRIITKVSVWETRGDHCLLSPEKITPSYRLELPPLRLIVRPQYQMALPGLVRSTNGYRNAYARYPMFHRLPIVPYQYQSRPRLS